MSSNTQAAAAPTEPTLVVYGLDGTGKPRASWFDATSADLATKAADLMKMRVLKVETEEQRALARELARGRVFASGRAFTPLARATVFSKLVELAKGATGHATDGQSIEPEAQANGENGASKATRQRAQRRPRQLDQTPLRPPLRP